MQKSHMGDKLDVFCNLFFDFILQFLQITTKNYTFYWCFTASQVRWEELKWRRELREMTRRVRWAKIAVMTFTNKKRINTELFIDRNKGLYIQKGDKETDLENISINKRIRKYLTSWRMGKVKRREGNYGNDNSLFGIILHYITWKERQTFGSLFEKTLSYKSKKYPRAKNGVFKQILWYLYY